MMDMEGKTIRLYETCPKCEGNGFRDGRSCGFCKTKGRVISYLEFGELSKAMQEIAKAAVKQVLAERDSH